MFAEVPSRSTFGGSFPAVIPSITLIGRKGKGILTAIGAGDARPMGEIQRERLFLLGERFMETGNTILRFPLTEVTRVTQVDADGRATQMQIIKPVRWAQRDIVSFMMTGFALGDQAIRNEEARVRAPAWP